MVAERDLERDQETHAYTPSLGIKKAITVRRVRRLPIKGDVLVDVGEVVEHGKVVAKTQIPGDPYTVRASYLLKCEADEVPMYMLKKIGDAVEKNEVFAKFVGLFGLIKNLVKSPVDGHIESLSTMSGQVIIRERPIPIDVDAYIPGKVMEIMLGEGAVIETNAAFIQGIFGVAGEAHGEIAIATDTPNDILTADHITEDHKGKIVVGGSLATGEALKKALEIGVNGVVVGGIKNADLRRLVGYDIGVAITGYEDLELTFICTEGFGKTNMSNQTFNLLKAFEGELAHINGATQIRAGVLRPEIIIPHDRFKPESEASEDLSTGMRPGTLMRIIRAPYFGRLARVVSLPPELHKIKTESYVRVVEIEFDDGTRAMVPRANVEIIEQ
ncbi:MAG: hypothetical protein AMS17_00095 [Spirochaetes bacterium DG_61]|jgi:hypothetical protein|nr:MAG: hypothetical protein AMS17_00095 [Spirochaetes bacterium DG_61]